MNIIGIFLSGCITSLVIRYRMQKCGLLDTVKPVVNGDVDFVELMDQIDNLSDLKEQLEEIEDMLTEIEGADPDQRGIALHISMPTSNNHYSMLANNSSEAVIKMLYSERQKLRSSLVSEIEKMRIRSNANVTQRMQKLPKRGVVAHE